MICSLLRQAAWFGSQLKGRTEKFKVRGNCLLSFHFPQLSDLMNASLGSEFIVAEQNHQSETCHKFQTLGEDKELTFLTVLTIYLVP